MTRFYHMSTCSVKNLRDEMEDRCFTQELILNSDHFLIYGVADGHGGEEVSNFLQHFIPSEIKKKIIKNSNSFADQQMSKNDKIQQLINIGISAVEKAEQKLFSSWQYTNDRNEATAAFGGGTVGTANCRKTALLNVDENCLTLSDESKTQTFDHSYGAAERISPPLERRKPKHQRLWSTNPDLPPVKGGSTLSFIILFQDVLIVFQIGDSFVCVYDSDNGVRFQTTPHNYTNQQEIERLKKVGVSFLQKKMAFLLEPSRGFGDFKFKQTFPGAYIINPEVSVVENIVNKIFIILGTDGLTENNFDITKILPSMVSNCLKDPKNVFNIASEVSMFASELCKHALLHKNEDNMTAVVLYQKRLDI
jgi:serine/threonine protein phosphatase PrpC